MHPFPLASGAFGASVRSVVVGTELGAPIGVLGRVPGGTGAFAAVGECHFGILRQTDGCGLGSGGRCENS